MSLKNVKEKRNSSDLKDVKLSMFLGAISLLQKPNVGSSHSLYFGFHAEDGCIVFLFLEKNTERKYINPFVMLMRIEINQMAGIWTKWGFFLAINIVISEFSI